MNDSRYVASYRETLEGLTRAHGQAAALELIVGGDFERIGRVERDLLRTLGLRAEDTVVDVGCGSGRLAGQLRSEHVGLYVGTDILPEILEAARRRAARPDWQFHVVTAPPLPVCPASADWICFFSVFTHLVDEDVFRYLQDARQRLKPQGHLVFSFLEFELPTHWPRFAEYVADPNPNKILTQFLDRGAIQRWCQVLGLRIERVWGGTEVWIESVADGDPSGTGRMAFGQSVAVLRRDDV